MAALGVASSHANRCRQWQNGTVNHTPHPAAVPAKQLDPSALGQRLRVARKQLGWTLAELGERSGVSITTISRAERGQLALGYENLAALARALGMDIGMLFAGAGQEGTGAGPVVTRAGEGVVYRGLSLSYEFLATDVATKPITPMLGTVHARSFNGPQDFARHPGAEFVHVLSGAICVYFENGEEVRLARGDSLYFDSRLGHAYVSVSRQLARIVGVSTNESELMARARQGAAAEPPAP